MTTPTQEALMALADSYLAAVMHDPDAQTPEAARAALASAIAEVVKDAERYRAWRADYAGDPSEETTPMLDALANAWTPGEVDSAIDTTLAARSAAQKTAGV
jgi:hypothetical protein